jgi:ribosome recycling factor
MTDDLVARLRADELPGDRQRQIEARIELWKILQEAADYIEALQKQLAASDEEIRALRDEIENLEYEMCEMENRS